MLWWVLGLGGGGCVVLTCITLVVSVGFLSLLGPQVTNAFTTNLGLQATSEAAQSPLTSGSGRASQVLTSSDGTIQIEVPSSWLTSNDLSTDAELQAAHLYDAQYVIVYRESKSLRVGLTLDDYTELVIRGFRQTNTETYVQSPKKTTVHGLPARRLELVGTRDGREGAYIVNVIEGENDFYRVFAYTRLERFERSRNVLEQIADSFRELR
ncbi:MAG: hypothetical protein MUD01_09160 [Chloroflexaceae bacterium]|jgi:hypothetical protein|nr:hypothetical protein [Chloroflexaceae bacterium]